MKEIQQTEELVNRVANSPLKTINLEDFYPQKECIELDIAQFLFQGLLLKEKDFRAELKEKEWQDFEGKVVCIHCSTDAIVPTWAYMLLASHLSGVASECYFGIKKEYIRHYYNTIIESTDWSIYDDGMIVIKGCGDLDVPDAAYLKIAEKLIPRVKSLMYGEPCSTVPVYKRPRK